MVVALDPRSLEGIFNSISTVGAFSEAEDEAVGLVELLRERLGWLENGILERRLEGISSRRAVVLESLAPPVPSGRWVPEMVRRAGGWELLGEEGRGSTETTWARVREVDPEVIVLALPGHDAAEAASSFESAPLPAWFDDLEAVRDGALFAVDGAGLILRPGPRIVEGIAVLAELFDPEGFAGAGPAGAWIPLGPLGLATRRVD
jgi:iron complex transport system substrate-binding protein